MKLINIAVMFNMIAGLFNTCIGGYNYLVHDDFEKMVFNMFMAMSSYIIASACAIIDSKSN